jgi:hypothetical protein
MPIGVAEGADGEHGAGGSVASSFGSLGLGQAAGFVDDAGGFDCPETGQTPVGNG